MLIKKIQFGQINRLDSCYMEPASNLDSISYGFVSRELEPCETVNFTDEKLYELCKTYGERTRFWRQKFEGLLPEVNRRRLYEKKGFGTVLEFAFKLAGMNEDQVRLVLNLEKRFVRMPALHKVLVNGEVGISKLAKIASIATPENDEELAMQVKLLPRSALETLVRDQKHAESIPGNTSLQQLFQNANLPSENLKVDNGLKLSMEVTRKLFELQQKGIDVNSLLLDFLKGRELKIAQEKEEIAKTADAQPAKSRYIPTRVRKVLKEERGTKCFISTCAKPAQIIHHTQRYGLSQNHDPHFLAPLCREHHAIAHSMDIKYQKMREQNESAGGYAYFAYA